MIVSGCMAGMLLISPCETGLQAWRCGGRLAVKPLMHCWEEPTHAVEWKNLRNWLLPCQCMPNLPNAWNAIPECSMPDETTMHGLSMAYMALAWPSC